MSEQKVNNAGASPETGEARREPKKELASIVRIVQTDIPGHKNILTGLTYIKGISWSISNAICKISPALSMEDLLVSVKKLKGLEIF